ncbi:MAG: Nif3-like dinuclear metal center hexameric protein, partial [Clostridia bacterium]|nr:Nif3-like dinuclear metal center hexameric protein [Clostridia bacterium]
CFDELEPLFGSVDAIVTGECSHHRYLRALNCGVSAFICGHFETENPAVEVLTELLGRLSDVEVVRFDGSSPVKTVLVDH